MTLSIYDELNPDWSDSDMPDLPAWEPWEDYEDIDPHEGGCEYCGHPEVRDVPEPFGRKPCCEECFNIIIGGEPDDPPWRCAVPIARQLIAALSLIYQQDNGRPT